MKKEGAKNDQGKPRFDLLPSRPLEYTAMVMQVGLEKYGHRNWEKGMSWGRLFGAMMRHAWAFWRGEWADKETGLPHLAHCMASILMLFELALCYKKGDDRSKLKV